MQHQKTKLETEFFNRIHPEHSIGTKNPNEIPKTPPQPPKITGPNPTHYQFSNWTLFCDPQWTQNPQPNKNMDSYTYTTLRNLEFYRDAYIKTHRKQQEIDFCPTATGE